MEEELDNIWIAVSNGDMNRVKHLVLNEKVSVDAQDDLGYSPMHAAASYGEIAILEFLRSMGANVHIRDGDGDTPILVSETPAVFEMLVQMGANPQDRNTAGEGIVEKIVDDENEELFEYLVERGVVSDAALIAQVRERLAGQGGDEEPITATMEDIMALAASQQDDEGDEMNT